MAHLARLRVLFRQQAPAQQAIEERLYSSPGSWSTLAGQAALLEVIVCDVGVGHRISSVRLMRIAYYKQLLKHLLSCEKKRGDVQHERLLHRPTSYEASTALVSQQRHSWSYLQFNRSHARDFGRIRIAKD